MVTARKLSGLLASLHAAPLEEENWQVFFDGLCEELLAVHGLFIAAGLKQGTAQILAQGGRQFNAEMQRQYNEYYWRIDPYWSAFKRRPRVGAIVGEELVTRQEAERTEFFNDLAVPTGVHHAMVLPAVVTPQGAEAISIWRSAEQKPFEKSAVALLNLLLPHVQAALKMRRALAQTNVRSGRAEAALNASNAACFILNGGGRVVHCNQAAETVLRLQDGLMVKEQKLTVVNDPGAQAELQALVAAAYSAGGAPGWRNPAVCWRSTARPGNAPSMRQSCRCACP